MNLLFVTRLLFNIRPIIFCYILLTILLRINQNLSNRRPTVRKKRDLGRPPPPFSVSIQHSFLNRTNGIISAVNLTSNGNSPFLQRRLKHKQFTERNVYAHKVHACGHNKCKRFLLYCFPFLLFNCTTQVYSMPGTNHVFVEGHRSNDIGRQNKYIKTIVDGFHRHSKDTFASDTTDDNNKDGNTLRNTTSSHENNINMQPFCFIADTDSIPFVIDTGANRIIVNDAKLLTNISPSRDKVKGVGGNCIRVSATGKLSLPLRSDADNVDVIADLEAVHVPSCPYNIIPPQLLIDEMKRRNFDVHSSTHDERIYTFTYKPSTSKVYRTLTIPISVNRLFILRSKEGFTNFMARASTYNKHFECFAGELHVIPDDDESVHSSPSPPNVTYDKTREDREHPSPPNITYDKTREDREHFCKPCTVPYDEIDSQPRQVDVVSKPTQNYKCNPDIEAVRRKQNKLLTIHERLGHVSFPVLKLLAKCGMIPKELENVDPPRCPGCAYGKAKRKSTGVKGWHNNKRSIKPVKYAGQCVSVDQLISPTPGFVPTHRGKPTNDRYLGATVFVDHYSDFTYVHLMTKMDAAATVEAKRAFERIANSYNVVVKHYHCDNGLFDTKLFKQAVQQASQNITFCGVNAHHQNGRAERRIQDITTGARTSLLHASHRWPKAINPALWPCALKHYVNMKNSLPAEYIIGGKNGRKKLPDKYINSPLSKFSGFETPIDLKNFHPFGSPVYVLENKLQAQCAHNKWADRSRVGIFLQHSPVHSSSVPLVLNTRTGLVSPQFHCLYDDSFSTCRRDAKFISAWQMKAKLQQSPTTSTTLPTTPSPSPSTLLTPPELFTPDLTPPLLPPDISDLPPTFMQDWDTLPSSHDLSDNVDINMSPLNNGTTTELDSTSIASPSVPPPIHTTTTRSGRVSKPAKKFADTELSVLHAFLATFSSSPISTTDHLLQPSSYHIDNPHPLALFGDYIISYIATDPDNMTLKEALQAPDRSQFLKAMHKELDDHISRKHWKVVPKKCVPAHKKCLPMIWAMKRKRNPLGEIIKWKARLCAGGHRSTEFIDYWDTYSPVVTWQTIRLVLILALVNKWHIRSIDFVLAFPQADVKTDIYMRPPSVPSSFLVPDLPLPGDRYTKVYKLIKNLYGLKDAGRTWNQFIHNGLLSRGWKQSSIDNCLYIKDGVILILYVDDACIISPHTSKINAEIKSLQKDFDLTDDGDIKDYIGTRFDRNNDGSFTLTQPRMMDRLFNLVGIDPSDTNTKMHDTPANVVLHHDSEAKPRQQKWHYRSVVGCLSYLQSIVRPDITFAVQQCAKFCNNPNQNHEEAAKRICRYLLSTKDKGLTLRPNLKRGLECHVDADFAGTWTHKTSHDPSSCHSRTGFVISYAGCPLLWKSRSQSLIALSTTEAEYITLSSALREVIAIIHLLEDLKHHGLPVHGSTPIIKCKTFEDNMSCVKMATNHITCPRTKHLSIRLHHFRSFVKNKIISIEHISTKDQIADIFTKPLPKPQFCKLRDILLSW